MAMEGEVEGGGRRRVLFPLPLPPRKKPLLYPPPLPPKKKPLPPPSPPPQPPLPEKENTPLPPLLLPPKKKPLPPPSPTAAAKEEPIELEHAAPPPPFVPRPVWPLLASGGGGKRKKQSGCGGRIPALNTAAAAVEETGRA
uniref:Uncharacterized protein n=1 Tax=Oryza barthii TaxID=65489 RepID=A0A0D3GNT4_9ORYZ